MSDENENTTADEIPVPDPSGAPIEPLENVKFPKKHLTHEQVAEALASRGLSEHPMTAFSRVGPKDGPHLTVSRAKKIARVYGHGISVEHPAVTCFTPEERKAKGLGGITCQLDLEHEEHLAGLGEMLDVVDGRLKAVSTETTPSTEE